MKTKVFLMLWGALCLTISTGFALELVTEARIQSFTGEPVQDTVTFVGQGYEGFVLKIINGEDNGENRISSAVVSLNGIKVLNPSDFNQNVSAINRSITPLDVENTLTVSLRSAPGGVLLVQVLGEPLLDLPADPGPDGDATIEGIDSNENGIRDDIERWIGLNYRNSEKTRLALTQAYYPLQNFMIHAREGDWDAVYNDMTAMQRANECLKFLIPKEAYSLGKKLHAEIVNTTDRVYAFRDSSRMLGGGSFPHLPRTQWKTSCNFDTDRIEN